MTDESRDVFDVIHSTRAIRRLSTNPVPDALVRRILQAGTAAPSAGNRQMWRFIVVKDQSVKREIQAYYKQALAQVGQASAQRSEPPPGIEEREHAEQQARMMKGVTHLTDHLHEAPVWIVACLVGSFDRNTGASIYPAVQNMLLATRALGLGSTLTTRHMAHAAEVERILGLPSDTHAYAILPIGYPLEPFGQVRRGPLGPVVYADRWGVPWNQ